jgi:hypothetical protein
LAEIVDNLDVAIEPFFTKEELNQLAEESGFIQRQRKLHGHAFLDLIVFYSDNLKTQSLNDLALILEEKHQIIIQTQSLNERFNDNALVFLKDALEKMLKKQLDVEHVLSDIKGINRVLVKDSVCFQIDESLVEYYPGSGGSGSKASVRIQFEYDILCGKINDLSVNAFNDQDAKDSIATIELIEKGDLIIRDLAYTSLTVLSAIVGKIAFYLCRLNHKVKVYEKKGDLYKEINFTKLYKYMKKNNIDMLEKEVYLGLKEKLKTRLIIHVMPEKEVAKRIRKARETAKKKGRQKELTKEYIARAHLNLFTTNAGADQIPAENVWKLYRLRWQIELAFKIWKSICNIEKVKKVKKHRLECYIYSKLIFIVLGWQIVWQIARNLYSLEGRALSFFKAFKTLLRKKDNEIREVFLEGNVTIKDFMIKFYKLSRRFHLLEKKQEGPTSLEILLSCSTV